MFQKYNDDNIISKFIKELLRTTEVPTIQVWKPGKPLIQGFMYVTKEYIVEALQDFMPTKDDLGPQSASDSSYFKIIKPYVEGMHYNGITSNYISNTPSYDAETHEYLGNYLRMYRDLHGIDLMPYYNCWNGTYTDKLRIDKNGISAYKRVLNDGKKVLIVPIKFNQDYTIYLNSTSPINYAIAYYDGFNLLQTLPANSANLAFGTINHCSTTHPFLISKLQAAGSRYVTSGNTSGATADIRNILLEEYLTLFIQVSDLNTTPITILEGNYTDNNLLNLNYYNGDEKITIINKLKNIEYNTRIPEGESIIKIPINEYCRSVSSLTRTSESFAFNDRLIEYLLLNVITNEDSITDNIERVQNYITSSKFRKAFGENYNRSFTKGVWDDDMQKYIYNIITRLSKYTSTIDINGFVDKDTEMILLRGK